MKIALIAGTHSGVGKTTLTLALLHYLRSLGQTVQAFKSGPDFIDPLWHRAATGRPSYNLDTRMIGADRCRELVARHRASAGWGLIEGVMGLFDGASGIGGEGSACHLAKVLSCPVLLVIDAGGMSASIAAVAAGFCGLAEERGVRIAGVIANRVGGEGHARLLRQALDDRGLPALVGWLEKSDIGLPERHLGLALPGDAGLPNFLPFLHIEREPFRQSFEPFFAPPPSPPQQPLLAGKTVAVARDAACCFIYPANLDWLREHGADTVFFSPVAGEPVPAADALWLPGGYPELHARQLARSPTLPALCALARAGMPILAECGGAMLLGSAIIDADGRRWPMAGLFPYVSKMQPRLAALGYRQEQGGVKGHEFHYSSRHGEAGPTHAFNVDQGDAGVRYLNVRASYVHWYFASGPNAAAAWFNGKD